ncbi:amino acid/polyamine transporter I, partial [Ilyonectria sp. MPI-CAGE-AT-0026]
WCALSSTILPTLVSGGAVTLVWGFVLAAIGTLLVTASLAELANIWPSSGRQYHWAAELASNAWRPVTSWITSWLAFPSMILGVTGSIFAFSIHVQVVAIACNPTYIFMLTCIINELVNIFCVRYYHAINIYVIVHQAVFYVVAIVTVLACVTPNFNSAIYVFTNFKNSSGWPNDSISFLIGVLGLATGFVALECAAHFSEEMKHATRDVPRAMAYSAIGNVVFAFPWIITLVFSMGSVQELVTSKFGSLMPVFQIFLNATKNTAGSDYHLFRRVLSLVHLHW